MILKNVNIFYDEKVIDENMHTHGLYVWMQKSIHKSHMYDCFFVIASKSIIMYFRSKEEKITYKEKK